MSEINMHCACCGFYLERVLDPDNEWAPEPDDDRAWAREAKLHHPTCEWVLSRAGQRPLPPRHPRE